MLADFTNLRAINICQQCNLLQHEPSKTNLSIGNKTLDGRILYGIKKCCLTISPGEPKEQVTYKMIKEYIEAKYELFSEVLKEKVNVIKS